jgi:N-acetylneuraminate synthase
MEINDLFSNLDTSPIIVPELGINHGGNLEIAKKMVDLAKQNGASLIKNQTHCLEDEMSNEAKQIIPGNSDKSIYSIIKENLMTREDEIELKNYVNSKDMIYFSTPFSRSSVDFLYEIGVPFFKIGSGECNNYPFVEYVARKKLPIILSTGMNSISSIMPSVEIFRKYKINFALLHCTNIYPTPHNLIRLQSIDELKYHFKDAVIGLSDHSTSNATCLAGIAKGAKIIERHFTDTKKRVGPDIICSMTPKELKNLIQFGHQIHLALNGSKIPVIQEKITMNFAFSSISATNDISPGEKLTELNIWPMRPGTGEFRPEDLVTLLGKTAIRHIPKLTQISRKDFID